MLTNATLVIVLSIVVVSSGCGRFSSTTGDGVVYAPTEIGTPVGDKVTKDIGPAGGTLSSPDGRVTLTVPQNALTEATTFSIQPITNSLKTGLGQAYRFGPDGKTFATPLELSVRYDEKDIEGSVPEALAIAFQDNGRNWHILNPKGFDPENKKITVPITHFTDFSFLSRFRIQPTRATIHPGEGVTVQMVVDCPEQGLMDRISGKAEDCSSAGPGATNWRLSGPGAIEKLTSQVGVYYVAPARKPNPNTATVSLTLEFSIWDLKNLQATRIERLFASQITILDRGYRVSGDGGDEGGLPVQAGGYTGLICSLEKPFTVYAAANNFNFKFTPSSESNGTWTVDTSVGIVRIKARGTYSIENIDSDKPRIKLIGDVTGTADSASGTAGGTHYFDLTPLDTNECEGK